MISLRVASLNSANALPTITVGFGLFWRCSGNGQVDGHCHTGLNDGRDNMRMGGHGSDPREAKQVQGRDTLGAGREPLQRHLSTLVGALRCMGQGHCSGVVAVA